LFEKLYPPKEGTEGRDRYVGAQLVEELGTISTTMAGTGNPEIGQKIQADLDTGRKGEGGSEPYNQAMDRLGKVLIIRRHDKKFDSSPLEMMGEGILTEFSKKAGEVYALEAKPAKVADVSPPSSKGKASGADEWADFDDPSAKKSGVEGKKVSEFDEWADFADPGAGKP